MTYLFYCLWILSLVLVISELDSLIARRLLDKMQSPIPEAHWGFAVFASFLIPGVGQFLNGQVLKAFFFLTWPFLTLWGAPIPRPWQMLAIKSPWLLLPWWLLAILDALVVGLIRQRRDRIALKQSLASANTADFYSYLERKRSAEKEEP